jgi:hypothetical protein
LFEKGTTSFLAENAHVAKERRPRGLGRKGREKIATPG